MTKLTTLLSVSTSDADKVLAEKCATFLNEEMTFCYCVCPAEVTFHKNSTDVTIKTAYLNEPDNHMTEGNDKPLLIIAARSYLAGYLAMQQPNKKQPYMHMYRAYS